MAEMFDLTVIGGGPIGLYSNQYALKKCLKTKLIEALPNLGGQLKKLYPEIPIHNIAGMETWTAGKMIDGIVSQTEKYSPVYCLQEKVLELKRQELTFEITTNKSKHYSRTILIATGPGIYIPDTLASLNDEEKEKAGILTKLNDKSLILAKDIVVVGGSEETVGWALEASQYARRVLIINWRFMDSFGVLQASVSAPKTVDILEPYELLELVGDKRISGIKIFHARTGAEQTVDVDFILMARGYLSNLNEIKQLGLEMEWNGVKVNDSMQTSIPGIFAAGDVVYYQGKQRLISTGSKEAATAVQSLQAYLKAVWPS